MKAEQVPYKDISYERTKSKSSKQFLANASSELLVIDWLCLEAAVLQYTTAENGVLSLQFSSHGGQIE